MSCGNVVGIMTSLCYRVYVGKPQLRSTADQLLATVSSNVAVWSLRLSHELASPIIIDYSSTYRRDDKVGKQFLVVIVNTKT